MRDIISNLKVTAGLAAQVVTADQSVEVDLLGFGSLMFAVNVGAAGDTLSGAVKFDLVLQHAEDDEGSAGSYEAVPQADCQDQVIDEDGVIVTIDADGEAGQLYKVGYVGSRRFVKLTLDVTGSHSNGTPFSVDVIRGNAALLPVS